MYLKDFTSKIPTPITALALGWVILGNVFQGVNTFLSDLCMVASLILIVLTFASFLLNPRKIVESFKTSVGMSLFSSITMALMMISIWMKGVFGKANIYIWVMGVVLHTLILVIFTIRYVMNFNIKNVTPSWFLVYIGIGIGAITCEDFGMIVFGRAALSFIVVASIVLTIPITISMFFNRQRIKNAYKPLFSLISIPLGIIIPAYIFISDNINVNLVFWMMVVLQIIFVIVLISSVMQIFNGFYPGWSCYTISGSITLYATSIANDYFKLKKMEYIFVQYILDVEYVIVFVVCAIILLAYLINVLDDPNSEGTHINLTTSRISGEPNKKVSFNLFSSKSKQDQRRLNREKRRAKYAEIEKNNKISKNSKNKLSADNDNIKSNTVEIKMSKDSDLDEEVKNKSDKDNGIEKFSNLID